MAGRVVGSVMHYTLGRRLAGRTVHPGAHAHSGEQSGQPLARLRSSNRLPSLTMLSTSAESATRTRWWLAAAVGRRRLRRVPDRRGAATARGSGADRAVLGAARGQGPDGGAAGGGRAAATRSPANAAGCSARCCSRRRGTSCWRCRGGSRRSSGAVGASCSPICASWARCCPLAAPTPARLAVAAVVVVACVGLLVWFWPQLSADRLTIPVTVYMAVLAAMVCAALMARLPTPWTALGAVCFAVSDAMIGISEFIRHDQALAVPIWWAYATAMVLITAGFFFGPRSSGRALLHLRGDHAAAGGRARTRRPGAADAHRAAPGPRVRLPGQCRAVRRRPARGAGAGPLPRPAGRRVRPRTPLGHRPRRQAGLAGPGGLAPSRCSRPRYAGSSTRWPPATPAPAPTCCGWRCRRDTPRWSAKPSRRQHLPMSSAPRPGGLGGVHARRAVPDRAGRGPGGPGGVAGAARRAVDRPARRGRGGHRQRRARRTGGGARTSATSTRCRTAPSRAADEDGVVALSAGLGPSARYRRWLAALRGAARGW